MCLRLKVGSLCHCARREIECEDVLANVCSSKLCCVSSTSKHVGLFSYKGTRSSRGPLHPRERCVATTDGCLILFLAIIGQPLYGHWSKLATGSGELLEQEDKRRMEEPRKEFGKIECFKKKLARRRVKWAY